MGMALENEFRQRQERQQEINNSIAGSGLSYTRDPMDVFFVELDANSVGEKPDFKSLAPGQRVAALLNYGKEYGIFNVHDCFDNVSANDFRIGDGTHMGLIYHNVYITIGKVTYNMDFQLGIKVTSKSYIDPIINMNIGSIDGRFDKNGNYIGTVFNKGYSMPLMITIWGPKSQGESFWKWYNGH